MIPISIINNIETTIKQAKIKLKNPAVSLRALLILASVIGCDKKADILKVTTKQSILISGIISKDIKISIPTIPTELFITFINPITVSVLSEIKEPRTGTRLLTANFAVFNERLSIDENKLP